MVLPEDILSYSLKMKSCIELSTLLLSSSCFLLNQFLTLDIRNNSQLNGLNVPDASLVPVSSTRDVLDLMRIGQKNRAVGATALNERSSRSHRYQSSKLTL